MVRLARVVVAGVALTAVRDIGMAAPYIRPNPTLTAETVLGRALRATRGRSVPPHKAEGGLIYDNNELSRRDQSLANKGASLLVFLVSLWCVLLGFDYPTARSLSQRTWATRQRIAP